jgi:hypothetical protein
MTRPQTLHHLARAVRNNSCMCRVSEGFARRALTPGANGEWA